MARAPSSRYDKDVAGMPAFAAESDFQVFIGPDSMKGAIPKDDENCAIALGAKAQLKTPYVSIGRTRADIAMPHPQGVEKPGYDGKWAVMRFKLTPGAKQVVIDADTDALDTKQGAAVMLRAQKPSLFPEMKRERNKRFRTTKKGQVGQSGKRHDLTEGDHLTEMGVRTLTGQRKR
jgi:hypothetical protein